MSKESRIGRAKRSKDVKALRRLARNDKAARRNVEAGWQKPVDESPKGR